MSWFSKKKKPTEAPTMHNISMCNSKVIYDGVTYTRSSDLPTDIQENMLEYLKSYLDHKEKVN